MGSRGWERPEEVVRDENKTLSVVIICRNEVDFIGQCIESVLAATKGIESKEVIVVDSGSTDGTVEVAAEYDVSVVQLRPEWRHTPAAGRYVGFRRSSGKYCLFVDGDCYLVAGFIEEAVGLFEKRPDAAAVVGRRRDIYYQDAVVTGEKRNVNGLPDRVAPVEATAGNAIYRRAALDRAGCFNPYLYSEEEAELSFRLREAGGVILGMPVDMVVHNTSPRGNVGSYWGRMRSNLHLGPGQILRYAVTRGMASGLFRRIGSGLHFLAWLVIGLVMFTLAIVWKTKSVFLIWTAGSGVLYLLFAAKSKELLKPLRYAFIWTLQSYSIIRGFLMKPYEPESYPLDVIVIKESGQGLVLQPYMREARP